ncbi:hypothetical protein OCC_13385 [Thermococcus litoralis DSM 5473]|uniref:Uncharacterized protein n=1 Tax=Thermococcus litoralis (strain ATCC 51850 / DSM 5473 / JCM 8560 / NS-C) TaxID=523849 RepID=S5Z4H4_THELN|nr:MULTISPECIES: hypothetical protein [Thermococcus]AGT34175.1 hypothetical protein OCC_13385 [Thermococcus litoralis DSM 5473]ALV62679.1 hypothetical protein ADU37_CDS09800 [Thermococcus sp. 2319x1]MDK2983377.1 hypothetical protein [Thermococcaceae archaeon]
MKKLLALLIGLFLLVATANNFISAESPKERLDKQILVILDSQATLIVKDFEERLCKMSDEEMLKDGLTKEEIKKVKIFCSLPKERKKEIILNKLITAEIERKRICLLSKFITSQVSPMSSSGTYSCDYQLPRRVIHATGIPTHSKLGAIPCSWTDPTPQLCKEEGEIACLWGCTNADPKLGWKKRAFNTLNDFVEEVTSKGYHKTAKYAAYGSYGYDYTRGIGYGYRYESWWNKNTKMGYSEGPEPNPEANWYGFSHGFWPELTFLWHDTC